MSFDLYYSFHRYFMRADNVRNPLWLAHCRRLELMYPRITQGYISPSVDGY
jgi:hypothetical protein